MFRTNKIKIDAFVKNNDNIFIVKKVLFIILLISSIIDYIKYPTYNTFVLIIISFLSLWIFNSWVLKLENIRRFPIAVIAFLNIFFFMYLPIPITLLDNRPVDYNLFIPEITFPLQFIYYLITALAFKISINNVKSINSFRNLINKIGYFPKPTIGLLWILGLLGCIPRLILMFSDISSGLGTLSNLSVFMYSPILILFMPFWGRIECANKQRKLVYIYTILIIILLIGTNARHYMITPIIILCLLNMIKFFHSDKVSSIFSLKKIILVAISIFLLIGPAADIALAMVLVRSERNELSPIELADKTLQIYENKDELKTYRDKMVFSKDDNLAYIWNENYVSNEFLARFCNYRVVDASIYHALKVGFFSNYMIGKFIDEILKLPPEPIPSMVFNVDKNDKFSQMDYLFAESTGTQPFFTLRVGGDVGLGLSIFGPFLVQLFVYIWLFKLFASFTYLRNDGTLAISFFAALLLMDYFYTFTVHSGIIRHISTMIWSFWYNGIILIIIYKLIANIYFRGKKI